MPVLIIGTERSGSNLLRLMLHAHSDLAVPHPPHFMRYLAPVQATYGDLGREDDRRALVRDALLLLRRHIHPWEHPIDEDRVLQTSSPSLFGVVAAIYEEYRRQAGKGRWGCKSTFMVDHVDEVRAEYPDARFVWLVRDPRDVAASAKSSVFGPCHPYLTAQLWLQQQEKALAAFLAHGPRQVHLVRYEDLVARPRQQLEQVCAFLGIPFEEAMVAPHRTDAAREIAGLASAWQNVAHPVTTHSVSAYVHRLSLRECQQVEAVTEEMMARLGYPRPPARREPRVVGLRLANGAMRLQVEWRARRDRNRRERWARDATVRWIQVRARARRGARRLKAAGRSKEVCPWRPGRRAWTGSRSSSTS